MTRRTFLASAAAGGVPPKPNIVIFLADDHGWNIAGCYGNRVVKTPNLDRFATEGLRFTAMFAGSPTRARFSIRACTPPGMGLWGITPAAAPE